MKITINGKAYEAKSGQTILDVARGNGIFIPTLCFLKGVNNPSSCRICIVEVGGKLIPACSTTVGENMVIETQSEKVISSRKKTLEMLLSVHRKDCENCVKNHMCEFQNLLDYYGISDTRFNKRIEYYIDFSSPSIMRDNNKCILCGRCEKVCSNIQTVHALTKENRGFKTKMGCAFDEEMKQSPCVGCAQCTLVCPTGALVEHSEIEKLETILSSKKFFVTAQVAPSVRVALSEAFGKPLGTFDEGKMVTALKMIGFDKVFDINMGADFTVKEEAEELVERIKNKKSLPQFSSCCPAWFKFVQEHFPSYKSSLSTCKSPTEMLGSIIKHYYSNKENIPADKIKVVGIMPCAAKKGEKERAQDVDVVLTTRELIRLIKRKDIDFNNLPSTDFDSPLSTYSGASLLFGVSGGVTEATLRYACHVLGAKEKVDFEEVRNSEGIKEVEVKAGDLLLKLCIVNGLGNARKVVESIISGEKHYDFVEVMACPGGCVNGGGQTYVDLSKTSPNDIIRARGGSIYQIDRDMDLRSSWQNEDMNKIYKDFFIKSKELSHKLLHY